MQKDIIIVGFQAKYHCYYNFTILEGSEGKNAGNYASDFGIQ